MSSPLLVLASGSPRRQELLVQLGVRFSVKPQNIDESVRDHELPRSYVQRVASEKAEAALAIYQNALILAADTSVIVDDMILGKPEHGADAVRMLGLLSNREHVVMSAVTIANSQRQHTFLVETSVHFRLITAAEAERYWETGEPAGKAGAYGIQGFGSAFVESIKGSYSNVVGLPLFETAQGLQDFGIPIWQQKKTDS